MAVAVPGWIRRRPALWMAALVAVVLLGQALRPGFVLTRRVDSASYWQLADAAAARDLLGSVRTPGYPLFLRGVRAVCPDLWCLPHAQLAIFGLSVLALFGALRRFGVSTPGAFAATLPLLASPLVPYFVPAVMTEAPCAAAAASVKAKGGTPSLLCSALSRSVCCRSSRGVACAGWWSATSAWSLSPAITSPGSPPRCWTTTWWRSCRSSSAVWPRRSCAAASAPT